METDKIISYAQNREDVILAGFFTDVKYGFYVDIGANHPVKDSVTKYFYDLGWHGLNVEPNEVLQKELIDDRPRDLNLRVGIADKPGVLNLRVYEKGDGLSTFSDPMKTDYEKFRTTVTEDWHEDEVPVITLKQLFEQNNVKHINFLKIDIEGYEYNALIGNDWERYRPEVMCIEANHILEDWRPLLKKNRYSKVFFDGLNEYYVAEEATKRAEQFSYVQSLLGRPIISLKWNNLIEEIEKNNANLRAQSTAAKKMNEELEQRIEILNAHIYHQQRFRTIVKNLFGSIDKIIRLYLTKHSEKPRYYPSIKITTNVLQDNSKLLATLHNADRKSFNGSPSILKVGIVYLVRAIFSIYSVIRKIFIRIMKLIVIMIRRFRSGAKK